MSLHTLLRVISIIGNVSLFGASSKRRKSPEILMSTAAKIFANWPANFKDFLRTFGEQNSSERAFGLRKQFENFYRPLLKELPRDETDFIRQEFLLFGLTEWGNARVDTKLLHGFTPPESRFISPSELARDLNVQRSTCLRMISSGAIQAKPLSVDDATVLLALKDERTPYRKVPGTSLGERDAAKWIGLPVSVLKSLRQSGEFEVKNIPSTQKAFHIEDLKSFKEKLLNVRRSPGQVIGTSIRLDKALRLKFRGGDGKSNLIKEILLGSVLVLEGYCFELGELPLSRDEVMSFLQGSRSKATESTMSVQESANRLECDYTTVPSLVQMGFLNATQTRVGLRVYSASLQEFESIYVSTASLAAQVGTSSRALVERLRSQGIPVLSVMRQGISSPQTFVERKFQCEKFGKPQRMKNSKGGSANS